MKRILTLFLALLLCAACCTGCKSKEERELEQANAAVEEMRQQVEKAQREYDQLNRQIEAYERASERVKNAK